MTIAKGESWGVEVDRPSGLQVVDTDAALAAALVASDAPPTALSGGDVFRTIGSRPVGERERLLEYPIDVVNVRLDGGATHSAIAHVLVRSPRSRGGWLRGPALVVMNAEFVGEFDVAPRGHPNDGRVESLVVDAAMPIRQRLQFRSRMRNASHLPHPQVATKPVRSASWSFDRPMAVIVDGVAVGRSQAVSIEVIADAGVVYG